MKLDICHSPFINTNPKWVKDLHVSLETMKLPKENTRETLPGNGVDKDFWLRP
jgi:hypothetical protein